MLANYTAAKPNAVIIGGGTLSPAQANRQAKKNLFLSSIFYVIRHSAETSRYSVNYRRTKKKA